MITATKIKLITICKVGMGGLTRALRSLFYSDEASGFNTRSRARFVDAAHVTDDVQTAERFRRHHWFEHFWRVLFLKWNMEPDGLPQLSSNEPGTVS